MDFGSSFASSTFAEGSGAGSAVGSVTPSRAAASPWRRLSNETGGYDEQKGWFVSEQGKMIADLLRRFVAGETLTDLCKEYGIPNKTYISKIVHHGQLSGTYEVRFRSPDIDVDQTVPVPAVPEVVSAELLEKVLVRLARNRTYNRVDAADKYLLSGFIRCGECGAALTGQTRTDRGTSYYRHFKSTCNVKGIPAETIESAVLDHLFGNFLDEPAFQKAVSAALPSEDARKGLEVERERVFKALQKSKAKLDRLVDLVLNGGDKSLLLDKQSSMKIELASLTKRLDELDDQLRDMPERAETARIAKKILLGLRTKHRRRDWRKLPHQEVRGFLTFLFGDRSARDLRRADRRRTLDHHLQGSSGRGELGPADHTDSTGCKTLFPFQFVEHHAQRINVAPRIDIHTALTGLLGAHVDWRPHHLIECRVQRLLGQLLAHGLGNAEVDDLGHRPHVVHFDQHVDGPFRFDSPPLYREAVTCNRFAVKR